MKEIYINLKPQKIQTMLSRKNSLILLSGYLSITQYNNPK